MFYSGEKNWNLLGCIFEVIHTHLTFICVCNKCSPLGMIMAYEQVENFHVTNDMDSHVDATWKANMTWHDFIGKTFNSHIF